MSGPSTSGTATVTILHEYLDSLAKLREGGDEPLVSFPDHQQKRKRDLAQTCLSRLNQARTAEIVGLLEVAVRVLRKQGASSDLSGVSGDELREVLASSSQPLAELLRLQVVSQDEEGLYGVCRIAWDHAHVGERVAGLMEEVQRREREVLFLQRVEGVERGLRRVVDSCLDNNVDVMDDLEFVGTIQRDVVENLTSLVAARLEGQGDDESGDRVDQIADPQATREEKIDRLQAQARSAMADCAVRSVVFEKGGLPRPRRATRLRALLEAAVALDAIDHTSMTIVSERLADLVFTSSVRRVLVTFGDAAKHPVGYREKVVLKVLASLKDDLLSGDMVWVKAVGEMLWHMVVGWYIEDWDAPGEPHASGKDSTVLKRVAFAKKLEAKVLALFDIVNAHNEGTEPYSALAEASNDRIKEILNRRRAAVVCAVRDAFFGIGSGIGSGIGAGRAPQYGTYREIKSGGALIPWLGECRGQTRDPAGTQGDRHPDGSHAALLGPDVLDEIRLLNEDTPLGCAETRLIVLESHAIAVARIGAALQENSALLSDGQYAQFVDALAEDIACLVVTQVHLQGGYTTESMDALWQGALHYTSCVYVARSLCLLRFGGIGSEGAKTVSSHLPTLRKACQRILRLGERELRSGTDRFQQEHLIEHLASLTAWRQRVDIQDIIAKKKCVSRILYAFAQLGKGSSLVGEAMVARITTKLVDWLVDIVIDSLIDQRDISEELSEAVPQILDDLCDGLDRTLGPLPSASVERLRQLCRIMRMTSGEIVAEFQDGALSQLFERQEIVAMIQALFELNPQVQANLTILNSDGS